MEDTDKAPKAVVGGVDVKSYSPLLGHVGKRSQQTIPKDLMLAFKGEGRGPFCYWCLLLSLRQTEKNEEKTRREPRNEEDQLHAEVERKAQLPEQVNLNLWRL